MAAGVMPSRLAVARSISTYACRPPSWKSLATSASCGDLRQPLDELRHPRAELRRVGRLDGELVLRAADAVLDRQVLHRLHVERDALDLRELRLQAPDDRRVALASRSLRGLRLISMRPLLSVALVPSTPMNDERLATAGSSSTTVGQRLLPLGHRRERDRLRRLGDALDRAGVLHREEALRDDDVEHDGQHQRQRPRPSASRAGGRAPSSASAP